MVALWGRCRRPPPSPPTALVTTLPYAWTPRGTSLLSTTSHSPHHAHRGSASLRRVSTRHSTSTPDQKDAFSHISPCRPTCLLSSTALRCHNSSNSPQQPVHNHKSQTQHLKTHSDLSRATTRRHLRPSNHHNHGAGSRASRQASSHPGASSLQTMLLRRRRVTMTTLATLKLRNPQAHSLPPRQNRIHGKRWLIVLSPPLHPKTRGGRDSCARQHSTLSPTASST